MKREFKKGEKVINKLSGDEGIVADPWPLGMPGFVLVQLSPASDGYCIPAGQLKKVEQA